MAYAGYLMKVGSWTFPMNKIEVDTYLITSNQRQDLDSTLTAAGILYRQVLPHTRTKVEFKVPPMSASEQQTIMTNIRAAWTAAGSELARECNVTYYDPETGDYKTMNCYMPDIQWQILDAGANDITYNRTRLAFIEK